MQSSCSIVHTAAKGKGTHSIECACVLPVRYALPHARLLKHVSVRNQCFLIMFSHDVSSSVFPDTNLLNGNGRVHGVSIQSKPKSLPCPSSYDKINLLWVWCFSYIKTLVLCLSSLQKSLTKHCPEHHPRSGLLVSNYRKKT